MKKSIIYIVGIFALFLASCSSYKFHTTRVQTTDFAQFKTYAWLPPLDSLSKDYYNNNIAKTNILNTANEELQARGLSYSKDNPDLLFRYIAVVNNKSKEVYANYYMGYGGPWGWYRPWGYGYYANVPIGKERVRYGHIILEAIDRKTNNVIWQARGTTEVNNPEKAINELPKIITGIIQEYPVKIKK